MRINKDDKGRTIYYVSCDALLIKGDKILLQRRINTGWNDGNWNLIGGHIEDDESLEHCIIRELHEELGITVAKKDVNLVHCMQHKSGRQTLQFYAIISNWAGEPEIQPEIKNGEVIYKADKLEWFNINSLPTEIVASLPIAVDCIVNGKAFSQMGYDDN